MYVPRVPPTKAQRLFLSLILSYHLHKLPAQKAYTLADFEYLPFSAPQPQTSSFFTPAHIFMPWESSTDYGIKCQEVYLPSNWLAEEGYSHAAGMISTVKSWIGWRDGATPTISIPDFFKHLEKGLHN